jgi:hypothetical protein
MNNVISVYDYLSLRMKELITAQYPQGGKKGLLPQGIMWWDVN